MVIYYSSKEKLSYSLGNIPFDEISDSSNKHCRMGPVRENNKHFTVLYSLHGAYIRIQNEHTHLSPGLSCSWNEQLLVSSFGVLHCL